MRGIGSAVSSEKREVRMLTLDRAGSHIAGVRAAAIMSLLATDKANGHGPHAWLTDVLTRLPTTLDRDIDASAVAFLEASWLIKLQVISQGVVGGRLPCIGRRAGQSWPGSEGPEHHEPLRNPQCAQQLHLSVVLGESESRQSLSHQKAVKHPVLRWRGCTAKRGHFRWFPSKAIGIPVAARKRGDGGDGSGSVDALGVGVRARHSVCIACGAASPGSPLDCCGWVQIP